MAKTNTAPLDNARITAIAASIRGAVSPFVMANSDKENAKDAHEQAREGETVTRESVMVAVANLSHAGNWTKGEAKAAASQITGKNSQLENPKAVAAFMGELIPAMAPGVREHVAKLTSLRDMTWDHEAAQIEAAKAAKTEVPTPLKDAFARKYHMLVSLVRATDDGAVIETTNNVYTMAQGILDARRFNPARVHKRLAAIVAELVKFQQDFPVDDIGVCVDTLNGVTAEQLKAAMESLRGEDTTVVESEDENEDTAQTEDEDVLEDVEAAVL